METQMIEKKEKSTVVGDMTVEEAYEKVCNELKAIYDIEDAL